MRYTDIKSQLEHQIQLQEARECGWIFDKNNSMKINFFKTGDWNEPNFVKIPLKSNALFNLEIIDKYFSLWSILDYLHPGENSHQSRAKNYRQNFI